jgi:hypothetical protein
LIGNTKKGHESTETSGRGRYQGENLQGRIFGSASDSMIGCKRATFFWMSSRNIGLKQCSCKDAQHGRSKTQESKHQQDFLSDI